MDTYWEGKTNEAYSVLSDVEPTGYETDNAIYNAFLYFRNIYTCIHYSDDIDDLNSIACLDVIEKNKDVLLQANIGTIFCEVDFTKDVETICSSLCSLDSFGNLKVLEDVADEVIQNIYLSDWSFTKYPVYVNDNLKKISIDYKRGLDWKELSFGNCLKREKFITRKVKESDYCLV